MFKIFTKKKSVEPKQVIEPKVEEKFSIDDITDEDMMVAALVAAIDFQESMKGNVRVVSIKQL